MTRLTHEQCKAIADKANFTCPICHFMSSKRAGIRKHLRKDHTEEDARGMGVLTIGYAKKEESEVKP